MKLHTIHKVRRARKDKDGAEGFVYMHQWPTGFQELVFVSEELAQRFVDNLNKPEQDERAQ